MEREGGLARLARFAELRLSQTSGYFPVLPMYVPFVTNVY